MSLRPSAISPPCLSIVIPTFNRVGTLAKCLQHLEQQVVSDFEVIVVDDGSSDTTPEFLENYAASGRLRLRFASQGNGGPGRARNLGLSMVESPLCLFIGDDTLPAPSFVEVHSQFHRTHPELRFAAVGLTRWSESEQTVTPFMSWLDNGFQFDYNNLLNGLAPDWRHFYTSNLSIKTELLRRHPFDEAFAPSDVLEDSELGYRLQVQEGLHLTFLPDALTEHVHPTDFLKACRRAYTIGSSYIVFESLWPDALPRKSRACLLLRDLLGRCAWLLPPSAWLVHQLTRFWCPNPLLQPMLSVHAAVGRRHRSQRSPKK
jgi:glycosyltransferase involved in cell wall biosynthesis